MQWLRWSICCATMAALFFAGQHARGEQLVIYSGRSKALVQPLIRVFERETGIEVQVRYGATPQLAVTLQEEGSQSPADLFWAQDAGALEAVARADLFAPLPSALTSQVPETFRSHSDLWVGTSGRARVLAYSPDRVDEATLPSSVLDLTDPKYRGRVGWAPSNGSFQAFVTAMRHALGEERTEAWLVAMKNNDAQPFANNTSILQAIAAEQIDLGLPNHYYLLRFRKTDANFPVRQTSFQPGDIGNLVFVSGIGRLKTSRNQQAAERFVEFLLSHRAQQYFVSEVYEYPMAEGVILSEDLVGIDVLREGAPQIEAEALGDLDGTLRLLRKVGLQ